MISKRQLQALILVNSFGLLSVILPMGIVSVGNNTSPIFIFLGGVAVSIVMAMAVSSEKLGVWLISSTVGKVVSIIICSKIIFCAGIWLRIFSESIVSLLLHKVDSFVLSILLLIISFYTACKGIETRGRVAELVFGYIVLVLLFIFLLSANNVDINNLKVLEVVGGKNMFLYTLGAMFGIEYLLFTTCYVRGEKKWKSVISATLLASVLLTGVVTFVIGVFGVGGVYTRQWAVLEIMDTIDFPLMLLERQDVLMLGFWIMSMFAFINGGVFHSGEVLGKVTSGKEKNYIMYFIASVLIFIISIMPSNTQDVMDVMSRAMVLNLGVEIFIIIGFIVGCRKK